MDDSLLFCRVDKHGFPHWDGFDFLRWYVLPDNWSYYTGTSYLWLYKTAWLIHHRGMIRQYAREAQIPELLLAGVAVSEVGGTPERFKSVGVLQLRQLLEIIMRRKDNKYSNSTSVGSIAIQLRAAAQTIGIRPDTLTFSQQYKLSQCLLDNHFNIRVVAFHLRDLILHDYPGIDTSNLTDEQIILAGSRYNRGIEREKSDFIDSIQSPTGTPSRVYTEYGRRIIEKKDILMKIMQGS